jgi:hypothetical protein
MKNRRTLVGLSALVLAACGGGGGSSPTPAAGSPPPAPAPSPPPPAPPPPAAATLGTWTANLSTCINPFGGAVEMTGNSLGHLPCLAGSYYAALILEDFSASGPRIGKTCNVTIALDGTFTPSIDGAVEATYHKTVDAVINGVEQSASFDYGYMANGTTPAVSAQEFWNGGSVRVDVDPSHIGFVPFAGRRRRCEFRPTIGRLVLLRTSTLSVRADHEAD